MVKKILTQTPARLEAFSDGVIAIIITLMILEIRIPKIDIHVSSAEALQQLYPLVPSCVAYILSFVMLGVLWVNHHNFFRQCKVVDRSLLWYNLHLLLWMSFIPVPTAFLGTNYPMPVAAMLYGFTMFMCALSFALMREYIHRHPELLNENITQDYKNKLRYKIRFGILLYFVSIFAGFVSVYLAYAIFVIVPAMYFLPTNIQVEEKE